MTIMAGIRMTPLYEKHTALGGQMTEFAGYGMPVRYAGIIAEHTAVRTGAGLFDVSHMGELWLRGAGAAGWLEGVLTNEMAGLGRGRAVYSPMTYETGGTVDDLIVYPRDDGYFIVVNASNREKDYEWMKSHLPDGLLLEDVSDSYAQLALQGPKAKEIMTKLGCPAKELPFFSCMETEINGIPVFISTTGYTGEYGYEIYIAPDFASALWDILIEYGAIPCGLGARDTLRMEAALPLYGHELSAEISPLEAGLSRFVRLNKSDFIGKSALIAQKEAGLQRELIGLICDGRRIPRAGCTVYCGEEIAGIVTSGGPSPTLGKNIALALIDTKADKEKGFSIEIRGEQEPARIVKLPFYSRK